MSALLDCLISAQAARPATIFEKRHRHDLKPGNLPHRIHGSLSVPRTRVEISRLLLIDHNSTSTSLRILMDAGLIKMDASSPPKYSRTEKAFGGC